MAFSYTVMVFKPNAMKSAENADPVCENATTDFYNSPGIFITLKWQVVIFSYHKSLTTSICHMKMAPCHNTISSKLFRIATCV